MLGTPRQPFPGCYEASRVDDVTLAGEKSVTQMTGSWSAGQSLCMHQE